MKQNQETIISIDTNKLYSECNSTLGNLLDVCGVCAVDHLAWFVQLQNLSETVEYGKISTPIRDIMSEKQVLLY